MVYVQGWTMAFFSAAPLDVREGDKKEYFRNPDKVGCPDLARKMPDVDYDAIAEEISGEIESDDVPALKEAKARKVTKKAGKEPANVEGSSSVAQRTKARRAQTSSKPLRSVAEYVNLDDDSESSQADEAAVKEEEIQSVETTLPDPVEAIHEDRREKTPENPVNPDMMAGSKRKAKAPPSAPRLKKPQFRRAPAQR